MFTYIETSRMQQRYAELNKRASQPAGWTHACPNAIDHALASVKALFNSRKPQQPVVRKPVRA